MPTGQTYIAKDMHRRRSVGALACTATDMLINHNSTFVVSKDEVFMSGSSPKSVCSSYTSTQNRKGELSARLCVDVSRSPSLFVVS